MKNIMGKSWRDSASLIVLAKRNSELLSRVEDRGGVNYDILLQTRTQTASFANSVVFPGGVTEGIDGSQRWLSLLAKFGFTKQDLEVFHRPGTLVTPIFQTDPIQRHVQLRITAIRETFEELGLLLCSRSHKEERVGKCSGIVEDIDIPYWQKRVSCNPEDWLVLCEEHKCYPDIWSLYHWSNWLTPSSYKKRFNAAFFLAAIEKKPISTINQAEVTNVEWLSPETVLNSDKILFPPQLYELIRLSHIKDISNLVSFASKRSGYDTDLSYPVIVKTKDGHLHLLPGDDLYPTTVDYDDNTTKYIDKTILELREGCQTINRFEAGSKTKQFVIQNYKPRYHINMEDQTISRVTTA